MLLYFVSHALHINKAPGRRRWWRRRSANEWASEWATVRKSGGKRYQNSLAQTDVHTSNNTQHTIPYIPISCSLWQAIWVIYIIYLSRTQYIFIWCNGCDSVVWCALPQLALHDGVDFPERKKASTSTVQIHTQSHAIMLTPPTLHHSLVPVERCFHVMWKPTLIGYLPIHLISISSFTHRKRLHYACANWILMFHLNLYQQLSW